MKNPRHWLSALLLLFSLSASAAEIVLTGTEDKVALTPWASVFEDTSASMDIADVVQAGHFSVQLQLLHPGYTRSAIWLKFDLANTSPTELTRWVEVKSERLQEVSLFVPEGNGWHRLDAGTRRPFSQRPIAATVSLLPLQLALQASQTVYLRVASSTAIAIEPTLWKPLAFRERNHQVGVLDGLILGSMVITAIYGLLMFVTLRDRAFFLLALANLIYGLYEASFRGYSFMYLWPEATDWATRSIGLLGIASTSSLILFIRELLQTRSRLPRVDRILLILITSQAIAAIGILFGDYRDWISHYTLVNSACIVAILWTTTLAVLRHFPASRYYVIAFAIVMVGNLVRITAIYGFFSENLFSEYATPTSALIANVFLLAAVVDRIMLARREKEEAQQALLAERAAHEAQLEQAVETRTADLNAALADVHAANQTKSRLLAYISHDLRAPLATIINYVHLLNRHASKEALEYQETIERCAEHQLELIGELVEYARGELDKMELSPAPTYLYAWLDGIAKQAELLARQYGNRFIQELAGDLPPVVVFDPNRLRQVLLNLLTNATKFTSAGDIRLCVRGEAAPSSQIMLTFAVEDTGPGIPQNDVERIFLPFERRKSEREGYGLGLSIARKIVRGMGDDLRVESKLGQGTLFSFQLMLDTADEADISQPIQAFSLTEFFGTGKTILVADDNPASRDYLEEILTTVGFDVICAKNCMEAWQQACERRFDAILVDQFMPGMGGWELLQKLHEQDTGTVPPVILCSAMPPQRPEAFPQHINFTVTLLKPVSAEKLLYTMQTLFNQVTEPSAANASPAFPAELLEPLRMLMDLGDISSIESWAEKFGGEHPEYADFALRIGDVARKVAMDELAALVAETTAPTL